MPHKEESRNDVRTVASDYEYHTSHRFLLQSEQLKSLFPVCTGISTDGQTVNWEKSLNILEPFKYTAFENLKMDCFFKILTEYGYSFYSNSLCPITMADANMQGHVLATSEGRDTCLLISRHKIENHYIFCISNISKTCRLLEKMAIENETDKLTGLLNRNSVFMVGDKLLRKNEYGLVAYMDLDNLKNHNDNWGHAVGDSYIVAMARYIERFYEDIPLKRKAIGRLAGDEFVICIGGFEDAQSRDEALEGLSDSDMFKLPNGEETHISFSTGVARYPEDGEFIDDLIIFSDFAMSMTKGDNKGGISFFSRLEHDMFLNISNNDKQLDNIIQQEAIEFIYIPYIHVESGNVAVFEMFPVSSVKGLEDINKIKIAAKHRHRICEIDTTIFNAMKREFKKLAMLEFSQVITLGYLPQDIFYQNELESLLELSCYPSERICLCFESEMRSHYDRLRSIDKVKKLNCRFGFKNYTTNTTSDAIAFDPHIVKLNLELSRDCSGDESKADTVKNLIGIAKEMGFSNAANIECKQDLEFFRDLKIDLLGGNAIYGDITADQIEAYSVKTPFWEREENFSI